MAHEGRCPRHTVELLTSRWLGVRETVLSSSALGRPLNKWNYEKAELPELAAAYGYGIVRNHPFIDGNKRTALLAI